MTDVAVDACCLINLLAADCVLQLPSLGTKKSKETYHSHESSFLGLALHVPAAVASESLYILRPENDDQNKLVRSPIDLVPYFTEGMLIQCDIEGEGETTYFVNFATRLDDGEAACMAVAKNRQWLLATDDRLAANLAGLQGVTVLTTAELLKRWAMNSKASHMEISVALKNIQRFAKFIPQSNSPEASWWLSHLYGE